MNPSSQAEAGRLFDNLDKKLEGQANLSRAEIIVCPPFVYLKDYQSDKYRLGAQNMFWEAKGAFTGEISAKMLKGAGCQYVIIGHSERRKYGRETNLEINKKLIMALKNQLRPILCVGEKSSEEMGLVVREQIVSAFKEISSAQLRETIVAYEPIWAIGSGQPCQPDDAMRAMLFIRKLLGELYGRHLAEMVPIIYGGSVVPGRAAPYIKESGLNGLLIGGASLVADKFVDIIKEVL